MRTWALFGRHRHESRAGKTRFVLVLAVVTTGFGLWASGAIAVFPDSDVAAYAGCLNTGGSSAGSFTQIAVGDAPAKPCNSNQMVVHLSGGDITAVRTRAGSGLTGGTENGAATLSLAGGFALPQSCSDQQVTKWNNASGVWGCADDNNNSYSNGTGLDLSSSNVFSLGSGYQLPQNCTSGQEVTSGGNNTWSCRSSVSGLAAYTLSNRTSVGCCYYGDETVYVSCPSPDIATGGGFNTDTVDIVGSGPTSYNGWFAHAVGGARGGTVRVYVRCPSVPSG